nr:immunoglobulin heavy chain junction region [Macaca mulatta]MOX92293.1 immunoglobulin heavy chain junction region [Macaca mulatta]MOX92949.1 immunoglobulin heavy chain junction region [Macaca mulatta]MOX95666.1 immunoglobulin heavy chain junction region [Macaca mulatta]MOX96414.1 immunoglobulin heavy chain junction region [Macaca mulatta]
CARVCGGIYCYGGEIFW